MNNYPYLDRNHYWTLTDTPGEGKEGLTVSDENATFYLTAIEYPEDVYEDIYKQSGAYCLIEDRVTFNYNYVGEDKNRYHTSIEHKSIIVKDQKFVGILTCCGHIYEVHRSVQNWDFYHGILFTDGTTVGINYDEFEGQPGACKSRTDYSLKKLIVYNHTAGQISAPLCVFTFGKGSGAEGFWLRQM